MTLCKVVLTAAMAGLFLYTFLTGYEEMYFFFKGNIVLIFLYSFIYIMFMNTYGGYKIGAIRLRELIFSNAVALLFTDFVAYFIMSLIVYKLLSIWPILICFFTQVLVASFIYIASFRLNDRLYPPEKALLIRSSSAGDETLSEQFINKCSRYKIAKTLVDEKYEKIVESTGDIDVLVVGMVDTALRNRLMAYCFEKNKQLFIMPTMEDIMLNNAAQYMAEDLMVYRCRNRAFTPGQLAAKRFLDIVLSAVLIIITLPITLITALAVKLFDGGPVFFRQKRLTRNGREFMLLKFRSMVPNAEKYTGAVLASENDPRITPVGRFIRACRIDELPQLWNVLKGDMSLVGPRPERPELFQQICKDYPQFSYRLKVKAGVTGYAQLYGKYNTEFEDKVRLDLLYIEKASILQDLQLLFYTLKILFIKESTEGVSRTEYTDAKNRDAADHD